MIVSINIILGTFLWFIYFTDYEIVIKYAEIWYPLIVGGIGFISYWYLTRFNQDKRLRFMYKLTHLPSMIGGLCTLILFIPPMCIFAFSVVNNSTHEVIVEQQISPNGMQVARVYRGYVGIVDADEKIALRVSHRWFPMIEREVFYTFDSALCTTDKIGCIRWIDNDVIQISGTENQVKIGGVGFSVPLWLLVIILTVGLFFPK